MALGLFREHPDEESIRPMANTRACGRSSMDGLGRPRTAQAWSSWRPNSSRRRRLRRRCTIKSGAAPAASGRQREEGAAEQGRLSQPGADVDAQPEEVRAREGRSR